MTAEIYLQELRVDGINWWMMVLQSIIAAALAFFAGLSVANIVERKRRQARLTQMLIGIITSLHENITLLGSIRIEATRKDPIPTTRLSLTAFRQWNKEMYSLLPYELCISLNDVSYHLELLEKFMDLHFQKLPEFDSRMFDAGLSRFRISLEGLITHLIQVCLKKCAVARDLLVSSYPQCQKQIVKEVGIETTAQLNVDEHLKKNQGDEKQ